MAEGVGSSDVEGSFVDMHIMECGDNEENGYLCGVPTQNRFIREESGRGSTWTQVRRSKRKKVSSSGSTDIIDKQTLSQLSQDDRFMCLYDILTKNNEVLTEMKKEQSRHFQATEEIQASVVRLSERVDKAERADEAQNECLKMLTYRSIDLEARSRRNNLILYGVTERHTLNVVQLVLNFMEDELDIDTDGIVIERAHRLGPRPTPNRYVEDPKRPIIVRFRDYMDTELFMRRAYKLKGTPFGIDRDYPKEISTARKQLYSSQEAKEARQARKKVQILYPAKLIIEGRLLLDKFPEWQRYMKKDRMEEIGSIIGANKQFEAANKSKNTSRNQIYSGDNENSSSESDSESVFSLSITREDRTVCKQTDGHAHQQSTQAKTRDYSPASDSKIEKRNTRGRKNRKNLRNKSPVPVSVSGSVASPDKKSQSCTIRDINTKITSERQRGKSKNRTGKSKSVNESTIGSTSNSTRL